MSGELWDRVSKWLLDSEPQVVPIDPAARSAAVLGAAETSIPLAALLATELRTFAGTPAALIYVWSETGANLPRPGFATFRARRLSSRLQARGLEAGARGGLVWINLSDDPKVACIEVVRAEAAVDCPAVFVVAGPRRDEFECLLRESDLVLLSLPSWADDEAASLAAEDFKRSSCEELLLCRPLSRGFSRVALRGLRLFGLTGLALRSALWATHSDVVFESA